MASVTVTADSPAILPVESGSETGDTDQIVDASRLPQADFQPEAETTPETALSESTKATPAENAELQPSAQASTLFQRQTPTRSVPSPALRYSRGNLVDKPAPPATGDASKLPGAFFFITMNYDNGDKYRVVAYDPWVQSGNSRQDIQNFYKSGFPGTLPYYEYFDKKAPGPWVVGDGKFYSGTFCKNSANKGEVSPAWYYTGNSASAIAKGVNIAFWNQTANTCGLFTSSINQSFDSTATTNFTYLYRGTGENFIPSGSEKLRSAQVDFYAMATPTRSLSPTGPLV